MRDFAKRLQPAITGGGYQDPDWWVWGSSVVRGEDGLWHAFVSRWPRALPFFTGYLAASEIVRVTAKNPEGPYHFAEVVLGDRGADCWDGRMCHNPRIIKVGDEYLLFYIGSTYEGPRPDAETLRTWQHCPWYERIRIGIARAPTPAGPWTRSERPDFDIDPAGWDCTVVTNPSPCLAPDGRLLLYYRSNIPEVGCRVGLASSADGGRSFQRVSDRPVVQLEGKPIEDPFVWHDGCRYQLLTKDLGGGITGEKHAGVHALSEDGIDWHLADNPKAWSRRLRWDDGREQVMGNIERPFLLMDADGQPSHLFAAVADGPGPQHGKAGFHFAQQTWNQVIPLA